VLEDSPHDARIVDQCDDPHRLLALGAFERVRLRHHEQHNSLLDLESLAEQALDQLALLQLAAVGVALECTAAT